MKSRLLVTSLMKKHGWCCVSWIFNSFHFSREFFISILFILRSTFLLRIPNFVGSRPTRLQPSAEDTSGEARSRAWKVSGTQQGTVSLVTKKKKNVCIKWCLQWVGNQSSCNYMFSIQIFLSSTMFDSTALFFRSRLSPSVTANTRFLEEDVVLSGCHVRARVSIKTESI